jgi:ATP-dependent DNA helicase DinG
MDALLDAADVLAAVDPAEIPMRFYAEKTRSALTVRRVDVSGLIGSWAQQVWSVHMSATLAYRGRFDPYLADVGLDRDRTLCAALPSPFPADSAIAYVPRGGPAPDRSDERRAWLEDEISRLVALTDGRALLIATSYAMADVMEQGALRAGGYEVHRQRQGESVSALLDRFRTDEHSVAVGVDTLREGVDIPGPACSLVVLDKAPNLPPDDPYVRATCGRADETPGYWGRYRKVNGPRAALAITQTAGRLVRQHGDRGVVACLDQRLWAPKGQVLREALRWPVTDSFERVERFWEQVRPDQAGAA